MKWTYDWLLDWLETTASAEEIAAKLDEIGLEIEDLIYPIVPVVAKVVECNPIPDTHLNLLKVDDGTELRQVVCGAPNCRVGLVSVLARPGCIIKENEIKVGNIKGSESNGMMCSPFELGLSNDHDGIIDLDEKTHTVGTRFTNSESIVFDGNVTANRADYLAVKGIARDLSAAGIGKLKVENEKLKIENITGTRRAIIENRDRCLAYDFAEIQDIKIAASSEKIAARLTAIGINPKNAPIDATNYVCFDLGNPMHCFDADEIKGDIVIRNAKDSEKFTDLFDVEHTLTVDDLVITDQDGILALAGIIGGKRGMTTDNTKNIILESAYFEPIGIRKTRRRLKLNTDASYRYERGIDPAITADALASAVNIISKQCGGKIVSISNEQLTINSSVIKYNPAMFAKRIGFDLDESIQREILEKLGYVVNCTDGGESRRNDSEGGWNVIQPSWRIDDAIPEKLCADIIRIYGYSKIPDVGPSPSKRIIEIKPVRLVNEFFARDRGLVENVSYGFGNMANEQLVSSRPNIKIANPMTDYMNTARNSLIPNMLDAVAENVKKGYPDLALFEYGTVFDGPNPGEEHKQLVIARTGAASPRHWLGRGREVDVFDVKADLKAWFGEFVTETDNPASWAHPYRYGRIVADGKVLGEFGELHPKLAKRWKIKIPVMIALSDGIEKKPSSFIFHPSSLPPITRDFSFMLEREIPALDIVKAARGSDDMITDVLEFDFFENSVAFSVMIEPTRNLSDTDLLDIQNRVIAAVEALGAKIRDK